MRQRVASIPRFLLFSLALTFALLIAAAVTTRFGETPRVAQAAVPGLGNLSGTVQASTSFKAAQVLIRNVDKQDLAKALKGTSAATREFFTSKMTQRAGALFMDEMSSLGPIRLKDVDEAQQRIILTAKSLADKGEIIIAKSGNEEDAILE